MLMTKLVLLSFHKKSKYDLCLNHANKTFLHTLSQHIGHFKYNNVKGWRNYSSFWQFQKHKVANIFRFQNFIIPTYWYFEFYYPAKPLSSGTMKASSAPFQTPPSNILILQVSRVLPNKLDKDIIRAQPVIIRFTSRKIRDRFFNAYKTALLKLNGLDEDYRTFYDKIIRTNDLKWFTARQIDPNLPADRDGNIFLNDHLAPRKKILFTKTRSKARELGYQNVWVDDHRIYVQKDDSVRPFIIGRETDLKKMEVSDHMFGQH